MQIQANHGPKRSAERPCLLLFDISMLQSAKRPTYQQIGLDEKVNPVNTQFMIVPLASYDRSLRRGSQ
jgi:hypothetical protein